MSNKYPGGLITSGANAGYSVFFDGTGDYLSISGNAAFSFAGDFTVEGWIYHTAQSTQYYGVCSIGAYTNGVMVRVESSGGVWYLNPFVNSTTPTFPTAALRINLNTWYHFAVVRSGTTVTTYLNGVSAATMTVSGTVNSTNGGINIGLNDLSQYWTGYVSNVRIVKGTALYTAAFTPPTQLFAVTNTSLLTCNSPAIVDQSSNAFTITANGNAAVSTFTPFQGYVAYNPALGAATPGIWTVSDAIQAAQTRRWNMYDPYFNYTTLLLHGNGTNGAQNNTFLDSSSNNFTITRNGNTTQGTFSPFSQTGWSNYFDGSSRITLPSNAAFAFGTGAYTVEFYVYHIGLGGTQARFFDAGSASGSFGVGINNTNALSITNYGGANVLDTASNALVLNQWNHVAFVRDSTSSNATRIYVNGTLSVTGTDSNNWTVTTTPTIAGLGIAGYYPISYLSNLRITKGGSLYTSNFTPSTTPLTTTVNAGTVSLLTCQSNRFIDNSANGFALTVAAGTPSVQAFSPFLTNVAYTPQAQGGSGYFDGTGDNISVPSATALQLNTSVNWTIEAWVYPTTLSGDNGIIAKRGASTEYQLSHNSGIGLNIYTGATTYGSGKLLTVNQWQHCAATWDGTTLRFFVNGVQTPTTHTGISLPASSTNNFTVGANGTTEYFTGYICGARLVKGTAVYTASFTPPTAPPTAITNTSFLCNFTNAGITDATAKNDLETVGNAQISTTQSKFGGSSLYFDGTGYLKPSGNQQLYRFGTGDFTVEMWVYLTSYGTNTRLYDGRPAANGPYLAIQVNTGGFSGTSNALQVYVSSAVRIDAGVAVTLNSWFHLAVCRSGTSTKMFVNGTQSGSTYTDSTDYSGGNAVPTIGASEDGNNKMSGYIDDLRISRYARYTANFTPQTSQWQDQ